METLALKKKLTEIKNSINRYRLEAEQRITVVNWKVKQLKIYRLTEREKDENYRKKPLEMYGTWWKI